MCERARQGTYEADDSLTRLTHCCPLAILKEGESLYWGLRTTFERDYKTSRQSHTLWYKGLGIKEEMSN